jgi:hypothetical protein
MVSGYMGSKPWGSHIGFREKILTNDDNDTDEDHRRQSDDNMILWTRQYLT